MADRRRRVAGVTTVTNRYQCDDCGWIYDPAEHGGKDLLDQDSSWACPSCQAEVDRFDIIVPADDDLTEADEEETETPVDVNARPILHQPATPSIETLLTRYRKGRLDPRPDFQRYQVWPRNKQARLIESILLNLPIPLIYLAEDEGGKSVVIDGQQRLMAIFDFVDGKYSLKGLGPLAALEGSYYADLDPALQARLDDFPLSVVEIKKESDPEIRFDLFERLNTGSTSLNDQELRNCVYRGEYNNFLRDVAKEPEFMSLLGLKEPHKRMADVELVLRFMAFRDQTYLNYPDKKTKQFLNRQMELGATVKARDREKAARDFKQAVSLATTVFGKNAFKKYTAGTGADPNGGWSRANNKALLDVQLWGFAQFKKGDIVRSADAIREAAIELMANNVEFADVIVYNTSDKKRLERRFRLWKDMLDGVVGESTQGARAFDRKLKVELFETNPECSECGQAILTIDDAHVDHVEAYSKGARPPERTLRLRIATATSAKVRVTRQHHPLDRGGSPLTSFLAMRAKVSTD